MIFFLFKTRYTAFELCFMKRKEKRQKNKSTVTIIITQLPFLYQSSNQTVESNRAVGAGVCLSHFISMEIFLQLAMTLSQYTVTQTSNKCCELCLAEDVMI